MWLIYQEVEGVKESINLNNVSRILCDEEDKEVMFLGNVIDDGDLIILQSFAFESHDEANDLFTAIHEAIAKGENVFEIKFATHFPKSDLREILPNRAILN